MAVPGAKLESPGHPTGMLRGGHVLCWPLWLLHGPLVHPQQEEELCCLRPCDITNLLPALHCSAAVTCPMFIGHWKLVARPRKFRWLMLSLNMAAVGGPAH